MFFYKNIIIEQFRRNFPKFWHGIPSIKDTLLVNVVLLCLIRV